MAASQLRIFQFRTMLREANEPRSSGLSLGQHSILTCSFPIHFTFRPEDNRDECRGSYSPVEVIKTRAFGGD